MRILNNNPPFSLVLAALLLMGPVIIKAQKSNKLKHDHFAEINAKDLRVDMDAFYIHFSGIVEEAADSIATLTHNDTVAANALFWKMNAIPAAQQAIFSANPIVALGDATVLCIQMDHFFKDGAGKEIFKDEQNIAIRASKKLRKDIIAISGQMIPEQKAQSLGDAIRFFALNNPINSLYFNRKNVKPAMAKLIEEEKFKLKNVAQNLDQNVQDLNNRIVVFSNLMPKQIRWQSEYMIYKNTPAQLQNIAFDSLIFQFDSLMLFTNSIPELIESERQEIIKTIALERELILASVQNEHKTAWENVDAQTKNAFHKISSQRDSAFLLADDLILKSTENAKETSKELIDFAFYRALIILALLFIGALILIWFYKR